ncbi:MAG: hypothetical protein OER95_12325 [Acidimicrobiia bacterium]|nr:hypothetical protein [Acidimicrobiia bacterium]
MENDAEQWMTAARARAVEDLGRPGDWLTGAQRVAVWRESRLAADDPLDRARRAAISPAAVAGSHGPTDEFAAAAVEVIHQVATDPGRLSRAWAEECLAELGPEIYTELVGVTAIARALDTFAVALGRQPFELPAPVDGEPARIRPDDVGDVGAWVPQTIDKVRANVSRALSLVPRTNATWREIVDSHYSRGSQFSELIWDRALSRVQVEAVAARTTSALDCFY